MSLFTSEFKNKQERINECAREHGWWEQPNHGEKIALMHSELSEALEALRHGDPASDHIPGFTGCEEELADCIIRIMDFAEQNELLVAAAIEAKMEFNETRPFKHGGKAF